MINIYLKVALHSLAAWTFKTTIYTNEYEVDSSPLCVSLFTTLDITFAKVYIYSRRGFFFSLCLCVCVFLAPSETFCNTSAMNMWNLW